MDTGSLHGRKDDRFTGLLIGSMLAVFVGMFMLFTIFLAPVGMVLIIAAILVAGYASYKRGDFNTAERTPHRHNPRHP